MFRQPGPDGPSDRSCPRSHLGARRSRASSFGAAPDPSHGGGTIGFLRRLFGLGKKAEEPPVEARFGADELARRLDVSLADLAGFRPEYRTFSIRKKGGGHRKIAAPDDRTKELQRRIDRRLLARLRPHDCATGFRKGFSVVNERPNLPRSVRRRLRAVEHHLATGREAPLTEGQLAGWKAFASMVERQRRMGE